MNEPCHRRIDREFSLFVASIGGSELELIFDPLLSLSRYLETTTLDKRLHFLPDPLFRIALSKASNLSLSRLAGTIH